MSEHKDLPGKSFHVKEVSLVQNEGRLFDKIFNFMVQI